MTRHLWALLVFGCTTIGADVQAQGISAILIGDTNSSLKSGVMGNLKNISDLLSDMQEVAGISVRIKEVKENEFSCLKIVEAVENLVDPIDTVIFYYAGHGYRNRKTKSKFPALECRSGPPPYLDADMVRTKLQQKHPRLALIILDACNSFLDGEFPTPARGPIGAPEDRKAGYRKLFLGYSGTIMFSGSKPSHDSYYMPYGPLLGGFFTNQLISSLRSRIASDAEDVTWRRVAQQATKTIVIHDAELSQTPQYKFEGLRSSQSRTQ